MEPGIAVPDKPWHDSSIKQPIACKLYTLLWSSAYKPIWNEEMFSTCCCNEYFCRYDGMRGKRENLPWHERRLVSFSDRMGAGNWHHGTHIHEPRIQCIVEGKVYERPEGSNDSLLQAPG